MPRKAEETTSGRPLWGLKNFLDDERVSPSTIISPYRQANRPQQAAASARTAIAMPAHTRRVEVFEIRPLANVPPGRNCATPGNLRKLCVHRIVPPGRSPCGLPAEPGLSF